MTKNIRYRGAVQPIAEYQQEVAEHQKVADREYDGQYRGSEFHHDKGADEQAHQEAQHKAEVQYRGGKDTILVG